MVEILIYQLHPLNTLKKPKPEGESDALPFTADGFHFRTPELGIQGYATDKELHILGKKAAFTLEMNDAVQIFEGKNEVWTKGNAKTTIDGSLEQAIKGAYDLKVESEFKGLYLGEVSVKYQASTTLDVDGDVNIYSGQKIVIRSTLPISIGTNQNTIGKLIAQGFSLISSSTNRSDCYSTRHWLWSYYGKRSRLSKYC